MNRATVEGSAVAFLASFCTLVIELVAGRVMAPYVGVSLYTWTSIIGVVLAGISLGAYFGGKLADRFPSRATVGCLLLLSGLFSFLVVPLADLVGGGTVLLDRIGLQAGLMTRVLLVTTLVFFPPALFLGMISPVVVKLAVRDLSRTGNVVGRIYAFSTAGAILGTFATGFFFVSWWGTRTILLLVGLVLILAAPAFGGLFRGRRPLLIPYSTLLLLVWPCWIYFSLPVREAYQARFRADAAVFHFESESSYYTIRLRSVKSGGRSLEALYLDNLIHSYNDLADPRYLHYDYLRVFASVIDSRRSSECEFRVLSIGGGGYTLPRYLIETYPMARVDVVEIDPEVTRVAHEMMNVPDDPRLRTFNEDARWFALRSQEEAVYDYVVADAFNDLTVPYHLTTREFGEEIRKLLSTEGILMANLIDDFRTGRFLASYVGTLESVFGNGGVSVVAPGGDLDEAVQETFVVLAAKAPASRPDRMKLEEALADYELRPAFLEGDAIRRWLGRTDWVLLRDDYAPVDNLVAPLFEERFGRGR